MPVAELTLNGDSVADAMLAGMSRLNLFMSMPIPAGQLLQMLFKSGSELRSLAEVPTQSFLDYPHYRLPRFLHRKAGLVQSLCLHNMLEGAYNAAITSDAELILFLS